MNCPNCQAKTATRRMKIVNGARERTYVCTCGWSFDTREAIFRTRSPQQRAKYFDGDYTTRKLAQQAKAVQRIKASEAIRGL